jgi:hypothetical protein
MRRRFIVAVALLISACAPQSAQPPRGSDAFALARNQALALGNILGEVQVCDGDAWQPPFHDFMAAKRERGLDGKQAATIATLVGAAQGRSDPGLADCSEDGRAKRVAALEQQRRAW